MVITSSNPNATQLVKANFSKWVLRLKFKKHKAGQMAGDIERRGYFVKLNVHLWRCLIAGLYIKELKQ